MTQPYVFWTLDAPFARIIGLYSNIDGSLDRQDKGPQEHWLEERLKDAPQDKCLIVAVHHPPYSLDDFHGGSPKVLKSLDNAIAAAGRVPDAVLSGHVHSYQRFSRRIGDREVPYLVAGAGGFANTQKALHKLQKDPSGRSIPAPFQTTHRDLTLQKYNQDDCGFLKITITATDFSADYFAVPFDVAPDGNVFDHVAVRWKK